MIVNGIARCETFHLFIPSFIVPYASRKCNTANVPEGMYICTKIIVYLFIMYVTR